MKSNETQWPLRPEAILDRWTPSEAPTDEMPTVEIKKPVQATVSTLDYKTPFQVAVERNPVAQRQEAAKPTGEKVPEPKLELRDQNLYVRPWHTEVTYSQSREMNFSGGWLSGIGLLLTMTGVGAIIGLPMWMSDMARQKREFLTEVLNYSPFGKDTTRYGRYVMKNGEWDFVGRA